MGICADCSTNLTTINIFPPELTLFKLNFTVLCRFILTNFAFSYIFIVILHIIVKVKIVLKKRKLFFLFGKFTYYMVKSMYELNLPDIWLHNTEAR